MKFLRGFRDLTRFEWALWITSLLLVSTAYLLSPDGDVFSLIASLIGVTALIFVAKGYVLGQALSVIFAVFYGIISFYFRYYGEMITYLGMSGPIAAVSLISWLRHPYKESKEVTVSRLPKRTVVLTVALTAAVTFAFYWILRALGNANLLVSTFSIATSFLAASLVFLRSPYYALVYACNDLVLILLWILAAREDLSCLPMTACFLAFLLNDTYGFFNWLRMRKRQQKEEEQ